MTPEQREALAEAEAHLAGLGMSDLVTTTNDSRVLTGMALNWSSVANGGRGPTRFTRDAFGSAPLMVPLLNQHLSEQPLGIAEVTPSQEGMRVRATLADTQMGRDVLALAQSGGLSGFSVGFTVLQARPEGQVRLVSSASLQEVSVVSFPADASARIQTAGGQDTPRWLHAADPVEIERTMVAAGSPRVAAVRAALAEVDAYLGKDNDFYAAWASNAELFGQPDNWERQQGRKDRLVWEAAELEWKRRHPRNWGAW